MENQRHTFSNERYAFFIVLSKGKEMAKQKKGFAIHPENINKEGRPKGSVSLVGMIKRELEKDPELARRIVLAYLKDAVMDAVNRRDILDRVDGKPKQTVEMSNTKDAEWLELFRDIKNEAQSETTDDPDSVREGKAEDIDS